jgi:hypothetical protein
MERFKQTIAKLENDIAELKQFQTNIQGSTQSKGDVHYCASTQEFGEYALDELDTLRFTVIGSCVANNVMNYAYTLQNPTPELSAYLRVQGKTFATQSIPVDVDNFEKYCMEKNGSPFVVTDEIRKCLESKLWEFAKDAIQGECKDNEKVYKNIRREFYTDITIPFTHTYTICPHVSFYITPISHTLNECTIHEITTKQVVFRIKYGNFTIDQYNRHQIHRNTTIFSGLKLHYSINGIVKQDEHLLDVNMPV